MASRAPRRGQDREGLDVGVDLYEHQGKELFRDHGIPTPRGIVARSGDEARRAAEELGGGAVVKVQVQTGGRGKGGGIVVARSPDEAAAAAERMLSEGFKGTPVTRVLCEELVDVAHEFYCAITLDRSTGTFLAMITDPGYREHVTHRTAGVADSRLIRLAPIEPGAGFGE